MKEVYHDSPGYHILRCDPRGLERVTRTFLLRNSKALEIYFQETKAKTSQIIFHITQIIGSPSVDMRILRDEKMEITGRTLFPDLRFILRKEKMVL
jgi:hypothetical protein